MAIRKLYFQLPENSVNRTHASDFFFETYYISEYISREISKENYKYAKATKFLIYLDTLASGIEYIEMFKVICCYIPEDYKNLASLAGQERAEKILSYILIASTIAEKFFPGILEKVKQTILRFRMEKYSNIWIFNQRTIKGMGKVGLECELDKEKFTLRFFLRDKDENTFQKTILETKPDATCYHYKFNKLIIDGENILVPDRFQDVLYQISFDDLKKEAVREHT